MNKAVLIACLIASTFTSNVFAMGSKRPSSSSSSGSSSGSSSSSGSTSTTTPTAFNAPWTSNTSTIVIDAYEGNKINWDKMATDRKVAAVIHRSTNGTKKDSLYDSRREIAKSRGYLWGAYHLGKKGNIIEQAKAFLNVVGDDPETLMILDLEDTNSSSFMSVDEAVTFMNYVYEQTGKIPVVYANNTVTVQLNSKLKSNALFQQSKLWYARFKSSVTDFPVGIWNTYFLWQFSSEINCTKTGSCLYNVPGTEFDMDVNVFNGSAMELAEKWNNH